MGLVIAVILVMAMFWWGGTLIARQYAESLVFDRLVADGSIIHAVVSARRNAIKYPERADRSVPVLHPEYDYPDSNRFYIVRHTSETNTSSVNAASIEPPMLTAGESRRGRLVHTDGRDLLYWVGGFSSDGEAMTVAVYDDMTALYRRLDVAAWYALAASLCLLVVLMAVQHLILRRTTSQLDSIRADVERLGHGEILALPEQVPDEVRPLVIEFNQLLGRFDHRLRQSRNTLGNLAHSLKGPLNLMIRAADETPEAPVIQQNAERIRQLIDGELRRARLVGRTSVGRRFDLAAEVETLAGLLTQVHADKHVDVRLAEGAGVDIVHDRQDMLELMGNLLDNAVKWADSLVMVNARYAEGLLLEIEDDGPGVSDDELARLTDRGVRLDESVVGHGLGLSIVQDIVATYGGTLELDRSVRLGGLRVSVLLPDRVVSR